MKVFDGYLMSVEYHDWCFHKELYQVVLDLELSAVIYFEIETQLNILTLISLITYLRWVSPPPNPIYVG